MADGKVKVAQLFAQFAEQCFHLFGDRVTEWFTHNEPIVVVECGYLLGFHYPDLKMVKSCSNFIISN